METNHSAVAVAGFFINEGVTELVRQLDRVSLRFVFCRDAAEDFRQNVLTIFPIIETIKYSGVEFQEKPQVELDKLSRLLREGVELTNKLLASKGWHIYHNFRLAKQMDKLQRDISRFIRFLPVYIMADVQQMRGELGARFDSSVRSSQRIEQSLWDVRNGTGGLVTEAVRMRDEAEEACGDGVIVAMENVKRSVRDMLIRRDDQRVGKDYFGQRSYQGPSSPRQESRASLWIMTDMLRMSSYPNGACNIIFRTNRKR